MQSLEQEGTKKVNLLHIYNKISCIRAITDGITNTVRKLLFSLISEIYLRYEFH